jgi:hypothetical protein
LWIVEQRVHVPALYSTYEWSISLFHLHVKYDQLARRSSIFLITKLPAEPNCGGLDNFLTNRVRFVDTPLRL